MISLVVVSAAAVLVPHWQAVSLEKNTESGLSSTPSEDAHFPGWMHRVTGMANVEIASNGKQCNADGERTSIQMPALVANPLGQGGVYNSRSSSMEDDSEHVDDERRRLLLVVPDKDDPVESA